MYGGLAAAIYVTIGIVIAMAAFESGPATAAPPIIRPDVSQHGPVVLKASKSNGPSPCTAGSPNQDCVTRAEARQILGDQWPAFLAQTSDRPRYERTFLRLWLNQETP